MGSLMCSSVRKGTPDPVPTPWGQEWVGDIAPHVFIPAQMLCMVATQSPLLLKGLRGCASLWAVIATGIAVCGALFCSSVWLDAAYQIGGFRFHRVAVCPAGSQQPSARQLTLSLLHQPYFSKLYLKHGDPVCAIAAYLQGANRPSARAANLALLHQSCLISSTPINFIAIAS